MSNISVSQIMMDAQRMACRVKDLDALSSALLVEAEGNNRLVESLRHFQDDIDSLNRISTNKSNTEMVIRIQQQNANSSEILKENRELKVYVEDYERAIELIMQKYREHTNKVFENKINFKEIYNEKLWSIIREQREKINEMAAVMQKAASADDEAIHYELENMSRLRMENKTLRELLKISKQFGSASWPIQYNEHLLEEKGVQTDDDYNSEGISVLATSLENSNNNSLIQMNTKSTPLTVSSSSDVSASAATDTINDSLSIANNNNGSYIGNAKNLSTNVENVEVMETSNTSDPSASTTSAAADVLKSTSAT